jgi:hypothetical protein
MYKWPHSLLSPNHTAPIGLVTWLMRYVNRRETFCVIIIGYNMTNRRIQWVGPKPKAVDPTNFFGPYLKMDLGTWAFVYLLKISTKQLISVSGTKFHKRKLFSLFN